MREERVVRGITGALIVLPLIFAVMHIVYGLEMARNVLLYGLGCTALGVAVGWVLGRRHVALQLLAALLPAAALSLALPLTMTDVALMRGILAAVGAALALWSERRFVIAPRDMLRSGVLLAPFGTLAAAGAFIWFTRRPDEDLTGMWSMVALLGALWFVVAIFAMNRMALRQTARAGRHSEVPAGARRSGTVGVVVFLVCSFVLASVGAVVHALVTAFQTLGRWALQAFVFLAGLLPLGGSGQGGGPSQEDMLPKDTTPASPVLEFITNVIIVVVLLAVAAGIVYGIYRLFPKLWKKLAERLHNLFATWKEEDEGYRDRTESLLTWRQAVSDATAGLRRFARRFRRRPRIEDFPTNAGKARFLFREYLHRLVSSGHEPPPGATATEIARPAPALATAYNHARYGEEEPGDREIERAREAARL